MAQISFTPGNHLLIDFFDCAALSDVDALRTALLSAANDAGATVLQEHFHEFGGHGGVTGVVLLAESHMSIHTWPEANYAAIDIFMCGAANADIAASALENTLKPSRITKTSVTRGQGH
ncbi:MAG: adenosylmethionine decarboxylase [Planktomarina sp.]